MNATKKITKATFKSFVKKNTGKLFVRFDSNFDGMTDCVEFSKNPQFNPATLNESLVEYSLGIQGVWLVNGSRNRFAAYDDGEYVGISYYNCCGSAVVAIKKEI
ncbi:hypothetical protein M0R04_04735 [Candidatus Dojkabacteria bacterium]|nr:hypothetical protein [Candidatus Dojkabacteria bacterium]